MSEIATQRNLYQRILGVMSEIAYIQKQGKHAQGFRYVKHDDLVAAIRPHLISHGIVPLFSVTSHVREMSDGGQNRSGNPITNVFTEVAGTLTLINADNPEERADIVVYGYGVDNSDKSIGKAISYACKYAILKAFFIETGDDPEADDIPYAAPKSVHRSNPQPQPAPLAPPDDAQLRREQYNRWIALQSAHNLSDDYLKQCMERRGVVEFKTADPAVLNDLMNSIEAAVQRKASVPAAGPSAGSHTAAATESQPSPSKPAAATPPPSRPAPQAGAKRAPVTVDF